VTPRQQRAIDGLRARLMAGNGGQDSWTPGELHRRCDLFVAAVAVIDTFDGVEAINEMSTLWLDGASEESRAVERALDRRAARIRARGG
jgi:hypothetical protein